MKIEDVFSLYEAEHPGTHTAVRRTVLALRRGGVLTVERLAELWENEPEQLSALRDIGAQRMKLIGEVLGFWDARSFPGS